PGGPRSRARRDDGGLPGGLRRCGRHRPARRRAGLAVVPAASAGRQLRCRARASARSGAAGWAAGAVMPGRAGSDTWATARGRAAAAGLDEQLDHRGPGRTGDVEQPHLRRWATVLTAPTTAGRVWLKALGPATAFEAGLYELLQRAVPQRVLVPIAVDAGRGWILLPDGGPPLADRLAGADLADALAAVLRRYGELQRDFASEAGAARAIGV